MKLKRTANAGVLLELDGERILLDGVCQADAPYLGTPAALRSELTADSPDALVFTHSHSDHYEPRFVSEYLHNAAGPVLGPADIPCSCQDEVQLGNITVTPVPCRHVGRTDGIDHRCYVIRGSRCVWFMGDASLLHWMKTGSHPKPDILIVPYGFVIGKGWQYCKDLEPEAVVVLHLPDRNYDPYGLWNEVEKTLDGQLEKPVVFPQIGQTITL